MEKRLHRIFVQNPVMHKVEHHLPMAGAEASCTKLGITFWRLVQCSKCHIYLTLLSAPGQSSPEADQPAL